MFLAIDAGNSNTVFSYYSYSKGWIELGRLETSHISEDEVVSKALMAFLLYNGLDLNVIQRVGFSSVVPRINSIILQSCKHLALQSKMHQLGMTSFKKLDLVVPRPDQIGTDLVADAYAAWKMNPLGYSLTVDFGTALTFTLVNGAQKRIEGVNIMPGIGTALKALFMNTAQLPEISLTYPDEVIGSNTEKAIRAGILYGYNGAVKEMIRTLSAEVGGNLKVCATGGMVRILTDLHPYFDEINPFLTVEGIRLITEQILSDE